MVTPPAPAGEPEKSASPMEALSIIWLWWTCTLVLNCIGSAPFSGIAGTFGNWAFGVMGGHNGAGLATGGEPAAAHMVLSTVNAGGTSPLPRLIAPDSVPAFAESRLLAICRLLFQPCM